MCLKSNSSKLLEQKSKRFTLVSLRLVENPIFKLQKYLLCIGKGKLKLHIGKKLEYAISLWKDL